MSSLSPSPEDVLRACAESGTNADWQEFINRFHDDVVKAVYRAARRWGHSDRAVLEELVQDVYLKVCDPSRHLLKNFKPERPGSAAAFIHVVATNLVIDHFKSVHSKKHGGKAIRVPGDQEIILATVDCSQTTSSGLEREILLGEIDKYLTIAAGGPTLERDRQVFWFYYRHGMSAREIAELPSVGLTTKGVESAILRLTRLVRELMVENQMAQAGTAG